MIDKNENKAEQALDNIQNYILKRSGLYFEEYNLSSLRESVDKRMSQLKSRSYNSYYELLTNSPESSKEFTELLNLLTIKHTHFFRNKEQFQILAEKILPEIIKSRNISEKPVLRIWSAGCSTGEEPFSIAMIVYDVLSKNPGWDAEIVATDVSTQALVTAKKGVYPVRELDYVGKYFIDGFMKKYCLIQDDKIIISPAIKKLVDFRYLNLIEEAYPLGFDVIFCRNVIIYFEEKTMTDILNRLYISLKDDGYFFTGGTETLYGISDKFEFLDFENALIYQKKG